MGQQAVLVSPSPWRARDASIFFICAACASLLCVACLRAARPRTDTIGFVLAPLLCLALMYENLALGVYALSLSDDGSGDILPSALSVVSAMLPLRGSVQAFIIPLWLISLFEITYTVHKRRSANFLLGLFTFDQGHRTTHTLLSHASRYSLWVVGVVLLLLQLTVNSSYTASPLSSPRTARFTYKGLAINNLDPASPFSWQDAVDFVPWVAFLAWALACGASLWRYGSIVSTDINATMANPWGYIFGATCALVLAWALSPPTWALPYATNPCELLLGAALVRCMGLVESNLKTLEEWDKLLTKAGEAIVAGLEHKKWEVSAAARAAAAVAAAAAAAAATAAPGVGGAAAMPAAAAAAAAPTSGSVLQVRLPAHLGIAIPAPRP
jgi:hypothetical protein